MPPAPGAAPAPVMSVMPKEPPAIIHECGEALITRDGYRIYRIKTWNLTENATCPRCNTPCVGIFREKAR